MRQVEAAVMGREPVTDEYQNPLRTPVQETNLSQPLFTQSLTGATAQISHLHTNGHLAAPQQTDFGAYSEGSDAEAEAGVAALQMANEQDAAEEARRQSGTQSLAESSHTRESSRPDIHAADELSSGSVVPIDINSYGGGFSGHVHYGDQPFPQIDSQDIYDEQFSENRAGAGQGMYDY